MPDNFQKQYSTPLTRGCLACPVKVVLWWCLGSGCLCRCAGTFIPCCRFDERAVGEVALRVPHQHSIPTARPAWGVSSIWLDIPSIFLRAVTRDAASGLFAWLCAVLWWLRFDL
jgi:hypothetical protein